MENQHTEKAPLPMLSFENHRDWFQDMYFLLERKEVEDALEKPQTTTPQSESTEGGIEASQHAPLRRKNNAECMFWIRRCIGQDDKYLIDNEKRAWKVWDTLKTKYTGRLRGKGRELIQEFVTYQMDPSTTINEAWSELTRIGQEIRVTHPGSGYHLPEERLQQLLSALPSEYRFIRQTIDNYESPNVDEVLLRLREEERMLGKSESAMFGRSDVRKGCFLCGESHAQRECPGLAAAKQAARKAVPHKVDKRQRISPPRSSRRRSSPDKDDLKAMVKKLTLEMAELKKAVGEQREKKAKYKKAYVAVQDSPHSPSTPPEQSGSSDIEEVETAGAASEARGKLPSTQWLLESGASNHMTDQLSLFRGQLTKITRRWIKVGGGFLSSEYSGDVEVKDQNGFTLLLPALYVPKLGVNLISGDKLTKEFQLKGLLMHPTFTFVDQNWDPVLETTLSGGVYVLKRILSILRKKPGKNDYAYAAPASREEDAGPPVQSALEAAEQDKPPMSEDKRKEFIRWHKRLGHLGATSMRKMHLVTTLRKAIPIATEKDCPCGVCALTKIRNMRGKTAERKTSVLELVSIDICGPIEKALNGERYFLHIVDNSSRKKWSHAMKSRDAAPETLDRWKLQVELQTGLKVKAVRLDNARELLKVVRQWESEFGTVINPTEAYNSIQNGVVERAIQTAETDIRSLLKEAGLPNEFWPEALQASTYMRNRGPTGPEKDGDVISPEEAFTGLKPSIDHLRTWGCKMYSYVNPKSLPDRQDKLVDRGRVGVFLGYVEDTTKQYLMWAPDMKKTIRVSANSVRFSEDERLDPQQLRIQIQTTPNEVPIRNPIGRPRHEELPVTRKVLSHVEIPVNRTEWKATRPSEQEPRQAQEDNPFIVDKGTRSDAEPQPTENSKKRSREEDADDEEPSTKHIRAFFSEICGHDIGSIDAIEWALSTIADDSSVKVTIPKTYEEATNDAEWGQLWKEAVDAEIRALAGNGTWKYVVPPKHANIVTSKWVFTVKYAISGMIEKFKARLVARGFSQKYGIDFEDTFAPTVRHDTLRLFMAVVCKEDLECHQIDVNNAFTESTLVEDIFMKPPPGVSTPPGMVLQLQKSLYGLKQAARDWNQLCGSQLREMGFVSAESDPCLFVKPGLMLLVYVDDITVAGKDLAAIQAFKQEFGSVFKIKDLGEVSKLLGLGISRDRQHGTLRLDQSHYVKDVLAGIHMNKEKAQPTLSPMDSYDSLVPAGPDDERVDRKEYQHRIGKWMYLGILTRPDISFALGRLSQYLADPTTRHMSALKKLSRYIRSSQEHGIMFSRSGGDTLEGYSDSDYAMDKTDRMSILGNVFFLAGGAVSWASKKQKSVATSTMEAEYMAMSACAKQAQHLAQVLRDMGVPHLIGETPSKPRVKERQEHAFLL
ncbi:hypothetical protein KC324_g13609 [Hortaea werneckii]|nr:hypothetical protein KC324_g13609 [Hortaea werneckii]